MIEPSLEYWNKLAYQIILISSLMSGFSIAVVVSLLTYETNNRFAIHTLKAANLAAGSFLISVFASTNLILITAPEYPINLVDGDLLITKIVGGFSLFLGITALSIVLALSGWIK